jgi:peptidoglycan hydrolase CwlO-like protein
MRILVTLALSSLLLFACHAKKDAASAAFAGYSLAYTRVVPRVVALRPSEGQVQDAISALGEAGSAAQTELDTLAMRSGELEAMVAQANDRASRARTELDAEALRTAAGALDAASKEASAIEAGLTTLRVKVAAQRTRAVDAGAADAGKPVDASVAATAAKPSP